MHAKRNVLFLWAALCLLLSTFPVLCAADTPEISHAEEEKESSYQSVFDFIVGQPAQNGVYFGLWSYHFVDDDEDYVNTHNLLGVAYKGLYVGTFLNSHEERAWAAGVQRDVYRTTMSVFSVDMGYRIGVMHGYQNLQFGETGLFPLLQIYADFRYKNVGIQTSWAGSVLTAGFFIRF